MDNRCWDQRIPNEPLFVRNFALHHPAVILHDRTRNTSACAPMSAQRRGWVLVDQETEEEAMRYWYNNVVNVANRGVQFKEAPPMDIIDMIRKYPERPWLYSTTKNVQKETELLYHTSARAHCPKPMDHNTAYMDLLMNQSNKRQDSSIKLWNVNTSIKNVNLNSLRRGEKNFV